MFSSIRSKITLPFLLIIFVLQLSMGIYISLFFSRNYLENTNNSLLSQIELMGDSIERINSAGSTLDFNKLAKEWATLSNVRVTFIAPDGKVLGDSHENILLMDNHQNRPEVKQAINENIGISTRYSKTLEYEMLYVAKSIYKDNQLQVILRIALPLNELKSNIQSMAGIFITSGLVAGIIAAGLSILIADRTTRPILTLTNLVSNLSKDGQIDKLTERHLPRITPDEVGKLAKAFITIAEQLNKQFIAVQHERNKIHVVLEEMTDGVLIVDENGIVQLINPAVSKIMEIKENHHTGMTLMQVLRHHQFYELWLRARDTREIQSTLLEFSAKKLYIHCTAIALHEDLAGSILMIIQNFSRQRYLETVRRDFVSNISHELRTPLASLKALTETLLDGAIEDTPIAQRFLMQMETEVDSLSHMVSELLELSRIESGQVPLRLKNVSPCQIINQAVNHLSIQAERADLQIKIECPTDLPEVLADLPRIEQVVVNLLHNSIKFTPPGGIITLSAININDQIRFSVQDNGVGIPAEELPRIFERFYKTDRSRTSKGTGLGLAIAKHMIESHGGMIWAESIEAIGSTFFFSIPVAQ